VASGAQAEMSLAVGWLTELWFMAETWALLTISIKSSMIFLAPYPMVGDKTGGV